MSDTVISIICGFSAFALLVTMATDGILRGEIYRHRLWRELYRSWPAWTPGMTLSDRTNCPRGNIYVYLVELEQDGEVDSRPMTYEVGAGSVYRREYRMRDASIAKVEGLKS